MENTKISWTHHTFNSWWGCTKISEGCKNCYAASFAKRTGHDVWGIDKPRWFFEQKHWNEPIRWNRDAEKAGERRRVFLGSMMDWAETHRNPVTQATMNDSREKLADLVRATPWLDWLFLTKRIEDAGDYLGWMFPKLQPNLWLGVTVENAAHKDRIGELVKLRAAVHFLSVEPLLDDLGDMGLRAENYGRDFAKWSERIDWVIVGGESGANCRPFNTDWARSIRDQCKADGVKFFMKQLGGVHNHRAELEDLPEDLRIREFPV